MRLEIRIGSTQCSSRKTGKDGDEADCHCKEPFILDGPVEGIVRISITIPSMNLSRVLQPGRDTARRRTGLCLLSIDFCLSDDDLVRLIKDHISHFL